MFLKVLTKLEVQGFLVCVNVNILPFHFWNVSFVFCLNFLDARLNIPRGQGAGIFLFYGSDSLKQLIRNPVRHCT